MLGLLLSAVVAMQAPPVAEEVRGEAQLSCQALRDGNLGFCDAVSETPPGRGFGSAAARATINTHAPRGARGRVTVPVKLRMSPAEARAAGIAPPGLPPLVEQPIWLGFGTYEEQSRFRPPGRAPRRGDGALLRCMVANQGRMTACEVLEETPAGRGYGAAAVLAAEALTRIGPVDRNGRPTLGRPVNTVVYFSRGGPPGPRGACPRLVPDCPWGTSRRR